MSSEELESFVNKFRQDEYFVSKYEQAEYFQERIFKFGMLPMFVIIPFIAKEPIEAPFIGTIPNLLHGIKIFTIDIGTIIFILYVVLVLGAAFGFMKTKYSYPVSDKEVFYHYLSTAFRNFLSENYEEGINELEKATAHYQFRYNPLHPKRKEQIKSYIDKVSKAKNKEESIKETYIEVFTPICREIEEVESDELVEDIIEDIEVEESGEGRFITLDVLKDMIMPAFQSGPLRVFVLILIIGGSIGIGSVFGTNWTMIILTSLVIYLGIFD